MPILVRPVREQLEHDRVIRLLLAKWKKRLDAEANVGEDRKALLKVGPMTLFPDLILTSSSAPKKIQGIVEVETGESVNNLEAMAQWTHMSKAKAPFWLFVPVNAVDQARRLCAEHHVALAELWSYYVLGDQVRFTLVLRDVALSGKNRPQPETAVFESETLGPLEYPAEARVLLLDSDDEDEAPAPVPARPAAGGKNAAGKAPSIEKGKVEKAAKVEKPVESAAAPTAAPKGPAKGAAMAPAPVVPPGKASTRVSPPSGVSAPVAKTAAVAAEPAAKVSPPPAVTSPARKATTAAKAPPSKAGAAVKVGPVVRASAATSPATAKSPAKRAATVPTVKPVAPLRKGTRVVPSRTEQLHGKPAAKKATISTKVAPKPAKSAVVAKPAPRPAKAAAKAPARKPAAKATGRAAKPVRRR